MLSLFDGSPSVNRRAFLQVGSLGLGGMSLANLLAARALGADANKSITTGKSVIFLLQHGGPTQFETFDPKMDVPDAIRTVGGVTQTSVPGTHFGASLPQLAKWAHRMAVVRSYASGSGGHTLQPLVSSASLNANIGALYARLAGANDPKTGMPTHVALFPNSVVADELGAEERFGKFSQTGDFGALYAPFSPGGGSTMQDNMRLSLPRDRFDERRSLLAALDGLRRQFDETGAGEGVDKFRQQAFDVVLQGVADAFDLSQEDPATIARYDTSHLVHPTRYRDKSNGAEARGWYQTNARTLGKQLLLARRLCERGCGFVTVATRFVWDMHADANNLGITRGLEAVAEPFDHAVAAFIEDCEARGLGDDILLVTTGEMGRTPKINSRGGRDHWGRLTPLMMYGGGITNGQVIGQSTREGAEPNTNPQGQANLIATIMHALLDIGELRLLTNVPSDLVQLTTSGEPIPRLFS